MKFPFSRLRFLLATGVIVAGFLFHLPKGHAGYKDSEPVYVFIGSEGDTTSMQMGGTLSDTRATTGSDLLYCEVRYVTGGTPTGSCVAYSSATNTQAVCETTDSQFVQLMASLKGDSDIDLTATQQAGGVPTCTEIWITNSSAYAPKQP